MKRIRTLLEGLLVAVDLHGSDTATVSRRNVLYSNYVANVAANLTGGVFLTGLWIAAGASSGFIALTVMLMGAGNLFQLAAPFLLERRSRRKPFLMAGRAFVHVVNIALIGLLPWLRLEQGAMRTIGLLLLLFVHVGNAILGPGLQVWHIGGIPATRRLGFLSLLSSSVAIVTYVALFLAGWLADGLKPAFGEMGALTVLRVLALVMAALDLWFLSRIDEPPNPPGDRFQPATLLACLRETPSYFRTVAAMMLWSFFVSIPGQYYTIYLLSDLSVGYTFLSGVNLVYTVMVIGTTGLWTRFLRPRPWNRTLVWMIAAYLPHFAILAGVGPSSVFLYPLGMTYAFLFGVGLNIGFVNLPYQGLPERNRTAYLAIYNAMNSFALLLGTLLGRIFMEFLIPPTFPVLGVELAPAQVLLLLTGLGMGLSLPVMRLLMADGRTAAPQAVPEPLRPE